jgi:hypothetical protein
LGTNQPSLLLHNLGEEKNKLDKDRATRVSNIFRGGEHRYVISRPSVYF